MALFYITGVSAGGKSTVRKELQKRGFDAHDTDEDDITSWYHKDTKIPVERPDDEEDRTQDWLEKHEWIMSSDRVEELAKLALNRTVFLCGSTSNQNELWHLFEKVYCLELDEETLKHRLATRTTNDFGKAPDELARILGWHKWSEEENRKRGATMINGDQPLNKIVDEIIKDLPGNIT